MALTATAAFADAQTVVKRSQFEKLVVGKDLTAFFVRLNLTPDGAITGRAFGSDVSGSWTWRNGYFCRVMDVGSKTFPENCQTVTVGDGKVTFRADKGTGDTARLTVN